VYVTELPEDTPFGFVTTTGWAPAVPDGRVHVIDVADATLGVVQALPPTVTVAPLTNPVPVIVRVPPPESRPPVGLTLPTVGPYWKLCVPDVCASGLRTRTSAVPVPAGMVQVS
jgi:hypothetical protein